MAGASWIDIGETSAVIVPDKGKWSFGRGELTTIALAKQVSADLTIIDDFPARRLAEREGLTVFGCVGVLESGFRRGLLDDLTGGVSKTDRVNRLYR